MSRGGKDFYVLSRKLHPDLNAVPEQEQEWSLQRVPAQRCYRTLKDQSSARSICLQLEGVELEEQSKSATEHARSTGQLKSIVRPTC